MAPGPEYPSDCQDGAPIPGGRRHTKHLLDLAEVSDCFHLTTVQAENKSTVVVEDSQAPLSGARKFTGDRARRPPTRGKDADETNDVSSGRLTRKRVPRNQTENVTTVTDQYLSQTGADGGWLSGRSPG